MYNVVYIISRVKQFAEKFTADSTVGNAITLLMIPLLINLFTLTAIVFNIMGVVASRGIVIISGLIIVFFIYAYLYVILDMKGKYYLYWDRLKKDRYYQVLKSKTKFIDFLLLSFSFIWVVFGVIFLGI